MKFEDALNVKVKYEDNLVDHLLYLSMYTEHIVSHLQLQERSETICHIISVENFLFVNYNNFTQVDTTRVKLDVLKPWIGKRVAEFIGMEDDVVVEFIFNQLEAKVTIMSTLKLLLLYLKKLTYGIAF